MKAEQIIQYISELEAENMKLKQECEGSVNIERFYASKMDIPEVARLHGVDPRTVRSYVKRGFIETHPDSTEHHTFIRSSIALGLDFRELRKMSNNSLR